MIKRRLEIIREIKNYFLDGFRHVVSPNACVVCEGELVQSESFCCSVCFSELAQTHYADSEMTTELDELFFGRIPICSTYALYYYQKYNTVKPVIHAFKYKNRADIAVFLGRLLGEKLMQISGFSSVDILIPTPLHLKKRYLRGYNQTEKIAQGISSVWSNVQINDQLILKKEHTKSQTKLDKFTRWNNVSDLFVSHPSIAQYRHVALVDDVITTGSTLEAIARSILKVAPNIQISIIGLAVTMR